MASIFGMTSSVTALAMRGNLSQPADVIRPLANMGCMWKVMAV